MFKKDLDFISIVLDLVFVIGFIYLLCLHRKHTYNTGTTDCEKIKDQMKFNVSLAFGSIVLYRLLLNIGFIESSLLVPIFLFNKLTGNVWLSFLLSAILYSYIYNIGLSIYKTKTFVGNKMNRFFGAFCRKWETLVLVPYTI